MQPSMLEGVPANVALARLLYECGGVTAAERALDDALRQAERDGDAARAGSIAAMRVLLRAHGARCAWLGELRATGLDDAADAPERTVERCARLFDWAVSRSEEGSVAAYSLGDPALLAAATGEVVRVLEAWGTLAPDRDVLEIGCGIGRLLVALAPRVRGAHGIDISEGMLAAARRRCADAPNVRLSRCSGRDLSMFPDARFHLVCALDSFPYIHRGGRALVERHIAEMMRVLAPGGDIAIFNWSYRDDPAADRREVAELAARAGLEVTACGTRPFTMWDGVAFRLRGGRGRPRRPGRRPPRTWWDPRRSR
jgi:SAM-dependent methyltransferase